MSRRQTCAPVARSSAKTGASFGAPTGGAEKDVPPVWRTTNTRFPTTTGCHALSDVGPEDHCNCDDSGP